MSTEKDTTRSSNKSPSSETKITDYSDEHSTLSINVPIRIQSEANLREHWTKKHQRQKNQKNILYWSLKTIEKPSLPVVITLVRIAPRRLDDDNLVSGFKKVRDLLADWLIPGLQMGRADDDERLSFRYDQKKGAPKEYAIEIKFECGNVK